MSRWVVHSNIWDSLVIIPLDVMSELCGLLLVCGYDQIPQHRAGAFQGSALFLSLYSHYSLVNLISRLFYFKAKVNLFQHIKFNGILLISYQDCT